MPRGSNAKRERQYEHIKESAKKRGESTGRAEEIAARTVNKERARSGEAKTASRSSTQDISSARRHEKALAHDQWSGIWFRGVVIKGSAHEERTCERGRTT